MSSSDGRWTIAYNGELYNTDELRQRLGRPATGGFRGHSDTEILVEAIAKWDFPMAVSRANGMFALAAWDSKYQQLWLARDRFGEKPLYYAVHQGSVLFASELKALRAVPGFAPAIDRNALSEFFRWACVPSPRSIYEGVWKLPPAHLLCIEDSSSLGDPVRYWSAVDEATSALKLPSRDVALEEFKRIFEQVVADRMLADVPLGALLSGGLDSSTVVAMMQQSSSNPVRTFTVGFTDSAYDESPYAKEVARSLGTDHTELVVSAADAMEVVPMLPRVYDEPFADSSQIPTYLVSHLARNQVTVALSGDGADELFGGYERHRQLERLSWAQGHFPRPLLQLVGQALSKTPPVVWECLRRGSASGVFPASLRHRTGQRMNKLARYLMSDDPKTGYESITCLDFGRDDLVLGLGDRSSPRPSDLLYSSDSFSETERAMLVDLLTYLPDDLLTKVDRSSMAVSLEVRSPFLDPDLFRFAWGLSDSSESGVRDGKWVLRESLQEVLPASLVDRPKQGFGVPVGDWVKGPLRSWAEDLLAPGPLAEQGYLAPDVVARCWREHLSGRVDFGDQIWAVLMFQAWLYEVGE